MLLKKIIYYLVFGLLVPDIASAQIVNIEDKRVDRTDTIGLFGFADVSTNLVSNGSKIFAVKGNARIDFVYRKHIYISITNYSLVRVDQQGFIDNGFQHLRYNYRFHSRMTYEAFAQAQYNEKTNLLFRGLLGTGMRFKLFKKEKQRIFFGILYMYEYDEQTDPELFLREHRLSNYLSFRVRLFPNNTLAATTYFQPKIDDFSDYRISSDASLIIGMGKHLQFRAGFGIVHDTAPPLGTPKTLYELENGLRWNF